MKYSVYTDAAASADLNMIGCAYLILTDDTYIASESVKITDTNNPTYAEVVSVGLAAAYLLDNVELTAGDTVTYHSDCLSAVEFCRAHMKEKSVIKCSSHIVRSSIKVTRMLSDKCKVVFLKVHGHKGVLNPNTVVDRLAKLPLRRN